MSGVHDFDWFVERLEVARWNNEKRGSRDAMVSCPVCGSRDNLHLTEKNGKALLKCFGCDASYDTLVEAIDDAPAVTIKAPRSKPRKSTETRTPYPAYSPTGELVANQLKAPAGVEPKYVWDRKLSALGIKPEDLHGGLPTLSDFDPSEPVIVVEGHGPAKALADAGFPVIATVTGKGGEFSQVGASVLYRRSVVLSPDSGADSHMDRVGAVVSNVASEVLVAPAWPDDFPDNGDAADYIEAYGVDALKALYDAAVPWTASSALAIPMAEVTREDVEPLVDDFAHPTAHTGLWGPNGSGKGVFVAWKIAARTRANETVLILDYEGHVGEWRARLEDFGAVMSRVYIALPLGLPRGMLDGAIWDQKEAIRVAAETIGANWVVVDSATAACGVADILTTTAPQPYFAALNHIGRPSITIGHVTKTEQLAYPFGSMAWRAYIRMGWSFGRDGENRELVNRKTNDYPEQDSVVFDWAWTRELPPQKVPDTLTVIGHATRDLDSRMAIVLDEHGELKAPDVHTTVNEDGYGKVELKTIQNRLSQSPLFEQKKGRRGYWSLVTPFPQINRSAGRGREEHVPDSAEEDGKKSGRGREEHA